MEAPCLKMISNWEAEQVMNLRKMWQKWIRGGIYPALKTRDRKEILNSSAEWVRNGWHFNEWSSVDFRQCSEVQLRWVQLSLVQYSWMQLSSGIPFSSVQFLQSVQSGQFSLWSSEAVFLSMQFSGKLREASLNQSAWTRTAELN